MKKHASGLLSLSFLLSLSGLFSACCPQTAWAAESAAGAAGGASSGHRYRLVVSDCTWNQAFQGAKEAGGHLATFESADEYYSVISQIGQAGLSNIMFRIGGRRDPGGIQYYWVNNDNRLTGTVLNDPYSWAYTQWMNGEPSFADGEIQEAYMDTYYYSKEGRWVLNDVPDDIISIVPGYSGKLGYIIEFEASAQNGTAGSEQNAVTQNAGTQNAGTQNAGTQNAGTQNAGTQNAPATSSWQDAYYDFLWNQRYLNTSDAHFGEEGVTDNSDSMAQVSFALRDMNADGIPELIIYNGDGIYAGSVNYLYQFVGGQVRYVDFMAASSYNFYTCVDELALPGVFTSGAHTGAYWTDYYSFDGTTLQSERVWEGTDVIYDYVTGETTVNTDPETGEIVPVEEFRTSNETLYSAYLLIKNDQGGTPLVFSTWSEIESMGWGEYLARYGYTNANAGTGTSGAGTSAGMAVGGTSVGMAVGGASAEMDAVGGGTTALSDSASLLSTVPDSFYFSSGAGAWGTEMTLYDDGSFSGDYHDSNMGEDVEIYPGGTVYLCNFNGRFTDFQKVDDYTWSMRLDSLEYESAVGSDWVSDGVHYKASDAYGIAGGDLFYLYLPGHPVDTLPEEFLSWANMYMGYEKPYALPIYGIYNAVEGYGWGSSE